MNPKLPAAFCLLALSANLLPAAEPRSADLGWISGRWCLGDEQRRTEEYWTPLRGGMLLGSSVTLEGERAVEFEFLRIDARDATPTFIAQPNGREPVAFKWTAGGPGWGRFENPEHDFPTRVEYRREGDKLRAQIAGPGDDGKDKVILFEYSKCRS